MYPYSQQQETALRKNAARKKSAFAQGRPIKKAHNRARLLEGRDTKFSRINSWLNYKADLEMGLGS